MVAKRMQENLKRCKLLVLDFDGVLTDNKVYTDQHGVEFVRCDRSDSLGIELVKKHTDVEIIILSKEKNPVVAARAKKLHVPCLQGVDDKLSLLKNELAARNILPDSICFVGNDINDIECLMSAGVGVAVHDSHPEVLKIADWRTEKRGGDGAVREVCELILKAKEKWYDILHKKTN